MTNEQTNRVTRRLHVIKAKNSTSQAINSTEPILSGKRDTYIKYNIQHTIPLFFSMFARFISPREQRKLLCLSAWQVIDIVEQIYLTALVPDMTPHCRPQQNRQPPFVLDVFVKVLFFKSPISLQSFEHVGPTRINFRLE